MDRDAGLEVARVHLRCEGVEVLGEDSSLAAVGARLEAVRELDADP
jgi:hypothetical protein